jgi:type IV secretion system protein VirB6
LPDAELGVRVQQAYDTMRLGSGGITVATGPDAQVGRTDQAPSPATSPTTLPQANPFGQPALPQTASWFAISTMGTIGGLRVAIGFLLAIAPLAIMALLFDATLGLFSGWLRALAGSAFALLAATIVAAIDLILVEGELSHVQTAELGVGIVDPQALTTIVLACGVMMIVAVVMAARMAGAIRIAVTAASFQPGTQSFAANVERQAAFRTGSTAEGTVARQVPAQVSAGHDRTRSVVDALAMSARREQAGASNERGAMAGRGFEMNGAARARDEQTPATALGATGRRVQAKRTRSATRRDGTA